MSDQRRRDSKPALDSRTDSLFRSERLFAALLWAYPARFRRYYGREMRLAFRSQLRDLSGAAPRAVTRFWLDTLADLLRAVPRQHLDAWSARVHRLWRLTSSAFRFPKSLHQEVTMLGKKLFGLALVLFAFSNIAYDAASKNSMGILAILVTTVAASVGSVMLARKS